MSQPSSFIQNTNYLARNIHLLERGEELLTPVAVRALTKALDAPLGAIVEDIKKGVSDKGGRKLDIGTGNNYVSDPSSVEYSAISITGSDPSFVVRHEFTPSHKPRDILNAVREAIVAYNVAAEAQETATIAGFNTELLLSSCREVGHGWLVRVTDAVVGDSLLSGTSLSNIELHVAAGSIANAVAPSVDYFWHKTTSSFLLLTNAVQAQGALMSAYASAQSAVESEASNQASGVSAAASEDSRQASELAQAASEYAQGKAEEAQGLAESAQEAAEAAQSSAEGAQSMTDQALTDATNLLGSAEAIDEAVLISYANRAIVDVALSNNLIILSEVKP